jgi:hypothetical protein
VHSWTYTLVVTNCFGAVTSAPVMLNVIAPVDQKAVPALILGGQAPSIVDVEIADALSPASKWTPLDSVYLTNAPQFYYDLTAPLQPQRYYRISQAGSPAVRPTVSFSAMVPAIQLNGSPSQSLRVDAINQYGPTDAWFTLGTATLSSPSQLFVDGSAIGQPKRLYRVVPLP